MTIAQNYERERTEVIRACEACGRKPESVRLVAVSKTVGLDGVKEAYEAGSRDFGENRPDQIVEKSRAFPEARWHFIGNIQSRRIHDIVESAALIHSVHELSHAEKIDRAAEALGKVQDILIEVNVSGEESKSGVTPEEAFDLVNACTKLSHVRVRGLMTMAPQGNDEAIERTFSGLATLQEQIRAQLEEQDAQVFTELSMGMSEDWRRAIAYGATFVRIGRAIFSDSFQE